MDGKDENSYIDDRNNQENSNHEVIPSTSYSGIGGPVLQLLIGHFTNRRVQGRESGPQTSFSDKQEGSRFQNLSRFMFERAWDKVHEVLFEKDTGQLLSSSSVLNFEGREGFTVLHSICQYQPPLELVVFTAETWPFLTRTISLETNQTALHIACEFGARSEIVKYLLQEFEIAATLPDLHGRLPLHLACRPRKGPSPDERDDELNAQWIQPGSAVIKALCEKYPRASNVEDAFGCNPLERVLVDNGEIKISQKILKILLDSSKYAWENDILNTPEEYLEKQDEKFSIPGYTPAAARAFLVRCRSNSSLRSVGNSFGNCSFVEPRSFMSIREGCAPLSTRTIQSLANPDIQGSPTAFNSVSAISFVNTDDSIHNSMCVSTSLPPYEEMLSIYSLHQQRMLSRSCGDINLKNKRRIAKGCLLGIQSDFHNRNCIVPTKTQGAEYKADSAEKLLQQKPSLLTIALQEYNA